MKIKDTTCYQVVSVGKLVEPRGVEPLSESTFTVTSPGAVCLLEFPPQRAGKQARRFGRVMLDVYKRQMLYYVCLRSKLCVVKVIRPGRSLPPEP